MKFVVRTFFILIFTGVLSINALSDDIELFFSPLTVHDISISPSGQFLSIVERKDKSFIVSVKNIQTKQTQTVFDYKALFGENNGNLASLAWIDNRYIAVAIVEKVAPIAELADTTHKSDLYFIDIQAPANSRDELITIKTTGTLINPLPEVNEHFLFSKNSANSKVYKIDVTKLNTVGKKLGKTDRVDGGQFSRKNRIANIKGYVQKWFTHKNHITGALVWTKRTKLELMETSDTGKTWESVKTLIDPDNKQLNANDKTKTIPVRYAGKPNSYYTVISTDGMPSALYRYNFQSGERSLIYQHASSDIYQVFTSYFDSELLSVSVKSQGEFQTIYFNKDYKNIETQLRDKGVNGYIALVGTDLAESAYVIYNFASDNPGRYLLYHSKTKQLEVLADVLPHLKGRLSSEMEVGHVNHDNLDIEYFLTRPTHKAANGHPLVVIPHGGPIGVMDLRLFDPVTQYLVSKHYAVLQVNYRGSAGYGKTFSEAGKKQWGTGMLEDIYAATEKVKALPYIDSSRICIAGASYGGYAALAMPIKHPGLFKCAAAFAAVTDVQLYASDPDANNDTIKWINDYIGNAANDAQRLKSISPVYSAKQLTLPLFIAHGKADRVVDIEHFYRLQYALNQANISPKYYLVNDLGHGFETLKQQIDLYSRLTMFLDEHIGR